MNNIYSNNLETIKNRVPSLIDYLQSQEAYDTKVIFDTKNNLMISRGDVCCHINSAFDKKNEVTTILKELNEETEVLFIFGLGNGSIIEEVLANPLYSRIREVVIIEPLKAVFEKYFSKMEIDKVINKFDKTYFIINYPLEEMKQSIRTIAIASLGKKVQMISYFSYRLVFETEYNLINDGIIESFRTWRTSIMTNDFFKYKWIRNSLENLKHITPTIDCLNSSFEGKIGVIVSAGPSLDKNIHLIDKLKNKAVVAAVGSSIGILNKSDIVPDLYFAIDAEPEQMLIFDGVSSKPILVYSDIVYPQVLNDYVGPKVKMITDIPAITRYIYDLSGLDYRITNSGFSVANIAVKAMIGMGIDKIVFLGQDFAYSNESLYAKNAWGEIKLPEDKSNYILTVDIYDKPIYTTNALINMKKNMERIIKSSTDVAFYNCTEGGLGMNGVTNLSLQHFIDTELSFEVGDIFEMAIETLNKYDKENYYKKIRDSITKVKEECIVLLKICDNYFFDIKKLSGLHDEKELNKQLDKYAKKLSENKIYNVVIEPIIRYDYYSIDMIYNKETMHFKQQRKTAAIMDVLSDFIGSINYLDTLETDESINDEEE